MGVAVRDRISCEEILRRLRGTFRVASLPNTQPQQDIGLPCDRRFDSECCDEITCGECDC